ncbi:hypothetical protein ABZ639_12645 [Saccharomonospora sp. NPDC006951]
MEWPARSIVAHIGNTLLWYAFDFTAGDAELSTTDTTVRADGEPGQLVRTVTTAAALLGAAVTVADPSARGWHPYGLADASGFVAMGCDELLIHTEDVARGLGVPFTPPDDLAEPVLRRLFPWAPSDAESWPALRWANGRTALPGRERLTRWWWHCAPLSEWDGTTSPM